jgi:photosystem II stability/assembly factor-like uncharacterized protein
MRSLYLFLLTCLLSLLSAGKLNSQQTFWEQTSGPPAGDISGCAMNRSGHIFCTSLGGYVYRSTDHGLHWKELTNDLDEADWSSIAINRRDYIFVGAWSYGGVFRSTDNGDTWTRTTFSYGFPLRMSIDSSGGLLVATFHDGAGIIRSTDDGETWSAIGPIAGADMNSLAVNANGHIFAGTGSWDCKVYRSTDNGLSWLFTGLSISTSGIAFNSQGHVYVARAWSYGLQSLFVSTDNGDSWDTITTCPPIPVEGASYKMVSIDLADNIYIAGQRAYATTSPGAYRSTDSGSTWTKISDADCAGSLFDQYHHLLIFTTNTSILHSTDNGDNWQLTGPVISRVRSLGFTQSGSMVAGLDFFRETGGSPCNAGVSYSSDRGSSWASAGLFEKSVQCVVDHSSTLMLVGTSDGIYSSLTLGSIWVPSGLQNTSVNCIEHTPYGSILAGTRGSGLYRSTDDGGSWAYLGFLGTNVRSIVIDALGLMCVGSENNGVYRSTDGGLTWNFVGLPNTTVGSMAQFGGQLFAATNSGVYTSPDNGTSWAYAGLAGRGIQDLLATSQNDLYAATSDSGVYRSTNGGQTWSALVSGFNHLNVTCLALGPEGFLYAGTDGGGVYKSKEVLVGVREETAAVPSTCALLQNYPNPFNPTTIIEFRTQNSELTILKVFDLLGREIATLVNEVKEPGTYTVQWDASGVSSGVYFYRLKAGSFAETKRLLLLK